MIVFDVWGDPRPAGSKRPMLSKTTGRAIVVDSGGKPLRDWRRQVTLACRAALDGQTAAEGPVAMRVEFRLRRPQRPRWPFPAVRPDWDKLARVIGDACRDAGAYGDDGQIVQALVSKVYTADGQPPGAHVEIRPVGPIAD